MCAQKLDSHVTITRIITIYLVCCVFNLNSILNVLNPFMWQQRLAQASKFSVLVFTRQTWQNKVTTCKNELSGMATAPKWL